MNTSLRKMLLDQGWSSEAILHIHLASPPRDNEFTVVPLKFHDLLHADRALRHEPARSLRYLHSAAHEIHDFLERHQPDFVFGENTWAHERIAAALCASRKNRWQFLAPHTVRFPAGRWGFFLGEDQATLVTGSSTTGMDSNQSNLNASVDTAPPSYVQRNNELLANSRTLWARLARVKRFLTRENIDVTDPTHIQGRFDTLKVMGREELNRILYKFVHRTTVDDKVLGRRFVLYALHKQPESSIDVLGRYYDDQFQVIHSIWRSLPTGWSIYVKEHTNAIGDRPPAFYKRISKLPNAYIVDEKTSAAKLIAASQAVFTISGTIAYEAALMGRPSFTFAPVFFNQLNYCRRITLDNLRDCESLEDLLEELQASVNHSKYFDILKYSYAGDHTDVYTNPAVMSHENLSLLESAYISLK